VVYNTVVHACMHSLGAYMQQCMHACSVASCIVNSVFQRLSGLVFLLHYAIASTQQTINAAIKHLKLSVKQKERLYRPTSSLFTIRCI